MKSIFTDREEANRWGFHGTPGFILMRTASEPTEKKPAIAIPGAFPFEMFAEEIDRLLNSAPHSNAIPAAPDTVGPTALAGAPLEPATTHVIR